MRRGGRPRPLLFADLHIGHLPHALPGQPAPALLDGVKRGRDRDSRGQGGSGPHLPSASSGWTWGFPLCDTSQPWPTLPLSPAFNCGLPGRASSASSLFTEVVFVHEIKILGLESLFSHLASSAPAPGPRPQAPRPPGPQAPGPKPWSVLESSLPASGPLPHLRVPPGADDVLRVWLTM